MPLFRSREQTNLRPIREAFDALFARLPDSRNADVELTRKVFEACLLGGYGATLQTVAGIAMLKERWGRGDAVKAVRLLLVFTFAMLRRFLYETQVTVDGDAAERNRKREIDWTAALASTFFGEKSEPDKWYYLLLNEQFKYETRINLEGIENSRLIYLTLGSICAILIL